MFARQVTTLAGTALVAGALGLAAVATSGTAAALRSADDTFVKAITAEGIGYDSSRTAINGAHHVCAALYAGASPADLTKLIPGGRRSHEATGRRVPRLGRRQLLPAVRRPVPMIPVKLC
jgi:hypothetical protein